MFFYESVLSSSINMSECNGKKRTRKSDWKQKLRELKEFQYELNDRNREDVDGPKRVNGFIIIIGLGTIQSSPPSVSSSSLSSTVSSAVSTEHCIQWSTRISVYCLFLFPIVFVLQLLLQHCLHPQHHNHQHQQQHRRRRIFLCVAIISDHQQEYVQ